MCIRDRLQRCGSHLASLTDVREAYLAGKAAVEAATAGLTDQMVALDCTRDASGYRCQTKLIPLTQAANTERKVPLDWITPEGNGIRQPFIDYALPLIPVSYTHLDVYKRQWSGWAASASAISLAIRARSSSAAARVKVMMRNSSIFRPSWRM